MQPATGCFIRQALARIRAPRELWKDTRLEVGYVGSRTRHWTSKFDVNAIAPANRLLFAQNNGNAAGNALKPFTKLTNGSIPFFNHEGNSQYDSLQTALVSR